MRAKRLMCLTTMESMAKIINYIFAPLVSDAISSKVVVLLLFLVHYLLIVPVMLTL